MDRSVAEVAVNAPVDKLFHYEIPDRLRGALEIGHRVLVPFGGRVATGVCVGFPAEAQVPRLKPIREILHPECRFSPHLLDLTRWIARYYRSSWGEVLETALPPPVRSKSRGRRVRWIAAARPAEDLAAEAARLGKRARSRARLLERLAASPGPHRARDLLRAAAATPDALRWALADGWAKAEEESEPWTPRAEDLSALSSRSGSSLHPDQEAALGRIRAALRERAFRAILLHGVTGSGKTEVYIHALRDLVALGLQGLVLVPEISLTPQIVHRFREGLPGCRVSVLHSMQGAAERRAHWEEIQSGRADVVIGARSAVFAPAERLGLIVVDEEHDASYKQESSPRYNARDVAVVRAKMLGIPAVLGSATPSLESYHHARTGKYELVELPRRVTSQDMPLVTIVPLASDFYRPDGTGLISDQLDVLVRQRLRDGEQVLLFLNRRGFATFLHCLRCGFVLKCPDCDIALTYHRAENAVRCHYCGYRREPPRACPDCDMPGLRRSGVGTEKVVAEVGRRYEEARIARLDRDAARSHEALRATVAAFARGEYDILVGTQMVAKGHDFPRVTLVGILNADTGLHFPDFRATERTFQLIVQVAGRAGRGSRPGRVVVQTFFPDHFSVRCAAAGEFEEFFRLECASRKPFGYPPFGRVAKVLFLGRDPEAVASAAQEVAEALRAVPGPRILGPVPAPIPKVEGKHRQQILLKAPSASVLSRALDALGDRGFRRSRSVETIVDVDPQSVL